MLRHIASIEQVASEIAEFKSRKDDPDCHVAGLDSYKNERLSQIKLNCLAADRLIGHSFFVIGESLIEANAILETKEAFEAWVDKNCNFKVRTAYNTILAVMLVREYPSLANMDKSLLYLMGSRAFPRKLTKIIADHQVGDFNLTKVDLLALKADYLEGKIDEDSKLVVKHLKKQNNIDLNERWVVEAKKLTKRLKNELSKVKELKEAQERVVGKNQTARKCSKTLENILSDAIKKCEEFTSGIDNKATVEAQDAIVSAAPADNSPGRPGFVELAAELGSANNGPVATPPVESSDTEQNDKKMNAQVDLPDSSNDGITA